MRNGLANDLHCLIGVQPVNKCMFVLGACSLYRLMRLLRVLAYFCKFGNVAATAS